MPAAPSLGRGASVSPPDGRPAQTAGRDFVAGRGNSAPKGNGRWPWLQGTADRESALFVRDGLERLASVVARSHARGIVLAGHSMGALVVMEAVRQMATRRSDPVLDKLQAVVLIAPDLDVDAFRMQVAALAPREVPIYIVASERDRSLRVAGLLHGKDERLGSIREAERLSDLPGVVVVDLTDVQGENDPSNHFVVATSPAMIALISGLDRLGSTVLRDETRQGNVFQATVGAVAGVTQVVLQPLVP